MNPEAIAKIASMIQTEWGYSGYRVVEIVQGPLQGSALATVRSSDGGEFYVGSDQYGQGVHSTDRATAAKMLWSC